MTAESPFSPLVPGSYSTLAAEVVDGQTLEVVEFKHYRLLRRAGAGIQSIIDLRNPTRVVNPVTALMLGALSITQPCRHALNLGVGGGTIERFLRACDDSPVLTSVEACESTLNLASRFFSLDTGAVVLDTAESHLMGTPHVYDVVFCDLYVGQSLAGCVDSSEFLGQLARKLTQHGTAVFNLAGDNARLVATLKAIRSHLPWARLVGAGTHGNVVVFSRHVAPTDTDKALQRSLQRFIEKKNIEALPFEIALASLPDRESG